MSDRRRTYPKELKEEIVELYLLSGKSMAQIEREQGLPAHTISRWKRTLGNDKRTGPGTGGQPFLDASAFTTLRSNRQGQIGAHRPGTPITTKEIRLIVDAIKRDRQAEERVIWSKLPINPEWVQYYGYTLFGDKTYIKTDGMHTGIDLGIYDNRFDAQRDDEFPVYARCTGKVIHVGGSTEPYAPGHVRVQARDHPYVLIYGHLVGITLKEGDAVDDNTLIGYLDKVKFHLHLELRHVARPKLPVNPWWFLGRKEQLHLASFMNSYDGTIFVEGKPALYSGATY